MQYEPLAKMRVLNVSSLHEGIIIQALMDRLGRTLVIQLAQNDAALDLRPNEWKVLRDVRGRWTGQIQLELGSQDRLREIFGMMHGVGIELNGI